MLQLHRLSAKASHRRHAILAKINATNASWEARQLLHCQSVNTCFSSVLAPMTSRRYMLGVSGPHRVSRSRRVAAYTRCMLHRTALRYEREKVAHWQTAGDEGRFLPCPTILLQRLAVRAAAAVEHCQRRQRHVIGVSTAQRHESVKTRERRSRTGLSILPNEEVRGDVSSRATPVVLRNHRLQRPRNPPDEH